MTPQALVDRLVAIFPDFVPYWADPGNCFREDDGSFNTFGVFAEFSGFFRERQDRLPADRIAALGALLSECMDGGDEDLANAAALGFLECRAGELDGAVLKPHLSGEALRYYCSWE
jgi:hypothetical protein